MTDTFDLKYNLSEIKSKNDEDKKNIIRYSNHPVHIVDTNGSLSPSSFIPFCSFGGNMSAMGVKIDQFDVPVCNSFKEKVLNGQLCYEVDPNRFIFEDIKERQLKSGLEFVIDLNKDRQVEDDESENDFAVYIDTLGKKTIN